MSALRAFHGDPHDKAKYVARVAAHVAADELVHGIGWENGKGCAIGCTFDAYDPSRGPIEIGLPEWLMRLEDKIFESLPAAESRGFVSKFLTVIPVGADVEPVRHKLATRRIDRLLALQRSAIEKNDGYAQAAIIQTIAALEAVRRCHGAEVSANSCDWSQARSATRAATQAVWSATQATRPAAQAVWSATQATRSAAQAAAAWSAWSATQAAWSATQAAAQATRSETRSAAQAAQAAAESAAWAAAWSAESVAAAWSSAWKQEAADLLDLLSTSGE